MSKKLVWNSIFVLAAVSAGIAMSLRPWQVYGEQRKLADQSIKEMRDAEKNRADLTSQRARLESSVGREEMARAQNYRKPEEKPIEEGP